MRYLRRFFSRLIPALLFLLLCVWLYAGSLIGVKKTPKSWLAELKKELKAQGHAPRFFVISGRRFQPDNYLLSTYGGAAKNSRHLKGEAIDIIVLDVNKDGEMNTKDVDIVVRILDRKIVGSKGGIGTYKSQSGFLNRQMVHFDSRGFRTRWNR